ncbi:hypothetical protein HIM_08472 [Hirsutella minnesotensis 3608]|uniref:Phosphatidylinositol-specific phospholipase C X domain-containing protein n=1 Tax=Hirsutella minnesotensis 3608 TaxID=1043627 RepID=A0A0F7ZYC0_9HYPO|nr:hypothetical protein HIM_08472 [Hirsutella minnesotensis 3608]
MVISLRTFAAAALVAVAGIAQAAPQSQQTQPGADSGSASPSGSRACNNSPALCSRQYNKITHMGAHDSSFLRDKSTGNSPSGNQFYNATIALDAGLRLLQTQVHKTDAGLRLCHSSCGLLDAGPLDTWLASVSDWVNRNPNDVVTLLVVNSDKAPAQEIASAFEKSGITKFAYKPASVGATGNWPTLDAMISQNTRVVSFVTNMDATAQFPYLIPEFQHIFETSFEVTQLTGFNCTLDRPKAIGQASQAVAKNYMGLANHFKYQPLGGSLQKLASAFGGSDILVPDIDRINVVNDPGTAADGNLGKHLEQCRSEWGQLPNFVLVDFWDRASPINAADRLNGLTSTQGRKAITVTSGAPAGMRQLQGRTMGVLGICLAAAWLWTL